MDVAFGTVTAIAVPPCGPLSLWRPQRQLLDFCLTTGKIIIHSGCCALVVDLEAVTKGFGFIAGSRRQPQRVCTTSHRIV
jgi:hypothetical protein